MATCSTFHYILRLCFRGRDDRPTPGRTPCRSRWEAAAATAAPDACSSKSLATFAVLLPRRPVAGAGCVMLPRALFTRGRRCVMRSRPAIVLEWRRAHPPGPGCTAWEPARCALMPPASVSARGGYAAPHKPPNARAAIANPSVPPTPTLIEPRWRPCPRRSQGRPGSAAGRPCCTPARRAERSRPWRASRRTSPARRTGATGRSPSSLATSTARCTSTLSSSWTSGRTTVRSRARGRIGGA